MARTRDGQLTHNFLYFKDVNGRSKARYKHCDLERSEKADRQEEHLKYECRAYKAMKKRKRRENGESRILRAVGLWTSMLKVLAKSICRGFTRW